MTRAFRRFALVEVPLAMLITVPGAFILAALIDVAPPATPVRVAVTVIPLVVPFIPLRWHMLDRPWWRAALLWMVVTVIPAMVVSLALWTLAG